MADASGQDQGAPDGQAQGGHISRVLVTGASGFVGRAVVNELTRRGYDVFAGSRSGRGVGRGVGVKCDVTKAKSVAQAVRDAEPDAVIHLVGIIAEAGKQTFERVHIEGTRNVIAAIRELEEKREAAYKNRRGDEVERPRPIRYLHMSALGADILSESGYSASKGEAEGLVRISRLPWTIFRPSLIFGVGDDFFGRVLKELVTTAPIVPQIGNGSFPFRPVSIEDVTKAFAEALVRPETIGQTYDLTGPEEFTFRQLLDAEQAALGQQKRVVPVPLALMDRLVPLMNLLPKAPITRDQYAMLKAGNTAPNEPARRALDLPMVRLRDRLPQIVRR